MKKFRTILPSGQHAHRFKTKHVELKLLKQMIFDTNIEELNDTNIQVVVVLRFYGPVNPMGSCRAQSVYLTTTAFTGLA